MFLERRTKYGVVRFGLYSTFLVGTREEYLLGSVGTRVRFQQIDGEDGPMLKLTTAYIRLRRQDESHVPVSGSYDRLDE